MYKLELNNRKSIRLKQYDYSRQGMYFITICVKNRECILSKINYKRGVGAMATTSTCRLVICGKIVENMILNIKKYYKNTFVDVYVIMPNHIHMIIELKQMIDGSMWSSTPTIPQIISTLKCLITKKIGYAIFQRNYYEHIIRNEKEYIKVVEYIKNNPLKWKEDELHVGAMATTSTRTSRIANIRR